MKLNVGDKDFDGIYNGKEWTTIDIAARENPKHQENFQLMSVLEMPESWTNRFEEIHMIHCLEHINRNFRQQIIKELHRVLVPGGVALVEVPDFQGTVHLLNSAFETKDERSIHKWTTSVYGKQRFPGDQHCWGYTMKTLPALFIEAGFSQINYGLAGPGYRSGKVEMISHHYYQEPVLLVRGVK